MPPGPFDSMVNSMYGDGIPPDTGQAEKDKIQHFTPSTDGTGALMVHGKAPNAPENVVGSGKDGDPYKETITIPPYRTDQPTTCASKCAQEEADAKIHCDAIRRRIAQWMMDSGCPSSVRGFVKKPSPCGGGGYVSAPPSCSTGGCGM